MGKGKEKEIEYTALREEYLILENRIHDLWKWGLISIVAILSSILFYFFEMAKDITSYNKIKTNISDYKFLILPFLVLIPSAITVLLGYMISNIKYVMKRLTGYLTVFHDFNTSDKSEFGWHLWNRVEKYDTNKKWFQTQGSIWVYILLLIFYTIILLGIYNAITPISCLAIFGIFTICIIIIAIAFFIIERFERWANDSEIKWNEKWTSIKRLKDTDLDYILTKLMLK